MEPSLGSTLLLAVAVLAAVVLGRLYFHRVEMERPPVGVFNLRDVMFVFVVLVVIPPLYLHLPVWAVGAILVVMGGGLSYFTLSGVVGQRIAVAIAVALVAGEVGLSTTGHGQSTAFGLLNNVAVGLLVVGVCNLWAQSGIHARDVAVFAGVVAVYDVVATGFLPLMVEFFARVQSLPFAPTMAFGHGNAAAGIGMGDLLFVLLWPLVAEKAYSRRAGLTALAGTIGCVFALDAAFYLDLINRPVPAMVVLGPIVVTQYQWFRRRYGKERTAGEYHAARAGRPLPPPPTVPAADLQAALDLLTRDGDADGQAPRYQAVHDGAVLASGAQAGDVARAARLADQGAVPVLVLAPPAGESR